MEVLIIQNVNIYYNFSVSKTYFTNMKINFLIGLFKYLFLNGEVAQNEKIQKFDKKG